MILGYIISTATESIKKRNKRDVEQKNVDAAILDSLKILLRHELLDLHEKYVIEQHEAPYDVKNEAAQVFIIYHDVLKGNGLGEQVYNEIMECHVKERSERHDNARH